MALGDKGWKCFMLGTIALGLAGILLAFLLVIYVSPKSSGSGTGRVNITFQGNGTGFSTQKHGFSVQSTNDAPVVPADIEMKFLAIYLWDDYNTTSFKRVNDDVAPLVWQNPECADIPDNECNTNNVTRFFNFTRSLGDINTEINSQHLAIPVGKYRYLQMTMCKHHLSNGSAVPGTDPNFRFRTGHMDTAFSQVSDNCGIFSTRADPPIEVTENSVITVYLTFTLDGLCEETDCTGPLMARQHPHDIGGHVYNCTRCNVPQFHIGIGPVTPIIVHHHSSSSSSTGVASTSSSSSGGAATGAGAGFKLYKRLYESEFRARFPVSAKP